MFEAEKRVAEVRDIWRKCWQKVSAEGTKLEGGKEEGEEEEEEK